ncbi:MAG: hypothetical protein KBT04_03290 [Bacteroidales bacterium]|nr:hypothetical protein [Candidatus Colimorpha onthohippi]
MKKILLIAALCMTVVTMNAQQVSTRAKALRYMQFARPEYGVKDVKIIADTMILYTLSDLVVYPFGKFNTLEEFINGNKLQWYREVGYRKFFGNQEVSTNRLRRIDDSYIEIYRAIHTNRVEMLDAKITDPEVVFNNGLHAGMSKEDVYLVYFTKYLKSYVTDVTVLKVISAASEVAQIYTFKGKKLRHIQVKTDYKFY